MLLLDINKFIADNDVKEVTTANIMKAEKFDDNGLFSNYIFGLPNSARWRSVFGFISLNTQVLHPLLYEIADRRASALLKFFTGEISLNPDTESIEKNSLGYYGIPFFIEHTEEICKQLIEKNMVTDAGIKLLRYIVKYKAFAFIDKLIVVPPQYRPVDIVRNKIEMTPINSYYSQIINDANVVRFSTGNNLRSVTLRIQKEVYQVYQELTNLIKGKQGIQRSNLLGKIMDFSARAVITGDINIEPNTIGVPEDIALTLLKPFVTHNLLFDFKDDLEKAGVKATQLNIGRVIDQVKEKSNEVPANVKEVVINALKKAMEGKVVLAKRDPCLHRHSVRGMYMKLVNDETFHIHPIICGPFNADFDGDQMAIFLPITSTAQKLAKEKVLIGKDCSSSKGDDDLSFEFKKDVPLGIYYLTADYKGPKVVNPPTVNTVEEAEAVIFEHNDAAFPVKYNGSVTTAGRAIFEIIVGMPCTEQVNGKGAIKILRKLIGKVPSDEIFHRAGLLARSACKIPTIIGKTLDISIYRLDDKFLKRKDEIFSKGTEIPENLEKLTQDVMKEFADTDNLIADFLASGAEKKVGNIKASFVAKGYVANQDGEIIPTPVKTATGQGLNPSDYYVTSVSGRSGLVDRSQMTANSGYMTRQFIYLAASIVLDPAMKGNHAFKPLRVNVRDKYMANGLYHRKLWNGQIIENGEDYIGQKVDIISPVYWEPFKLGLDCLPYDLYDKLGSYNVGILAAQAVGERGAQLTMQTFHSTSSKGAANFLSANPDIKNVCIQDKHDNVIATVPIIVTVPKEEILSNASGEMTFKSFTIESGKLKIVLDLPYDFTLLVNDPDDLEDIGNAFRIPYAKDIIFGSMKNSAGSTTGAVMQVQKLAQQTNITNPDKLVELMYYNTLPGVPMWAFEIFVSQLFRNAKTPAIPYRCDHKGEPLRVGLKQVAVYENWRRGAAFENVSKAFTTAVLTDDNSFRIKSDLDDIVNA